MRLRAVLNDYNIPFISMECDGGELSLNQIRLLEKIIVKVEDIKRKCGSAQV